MTVEVAAAFDRLGFPLFWSSPNGCSGGAVADSTDFWSLIWDNRATLSGIAHTHPWNGGTCPSDTDVTTWAAIEAGVGKRLIWPIVTLTHVQYFQHVRAEDKDDPLVTGEEVSEKVRLGYVGLVHVDFRDTTQWLETVLKMRRLSLNNGG